MALKLNKKYLAPLASLLVTGGLLMTVGVLLLGSSFGWFSHNDRVTATGLSVSSISPYKTEQALYELKDGQLTKLTGTAEAALFAEMLPGDKRTVYLGVTNKDTVTLDLQVLLSAPSRGTDSGYTATVTEGSNAVTEHYYLGSQIRVSDIKLATATGATTGDEICAVEGKNAFLLTMPDAFYQNGKQNTGATEAQVTAAFESAAQKKLTDTGSITVAPDETVYVAITFEFAENNQVQNPYINFGADSTKAAPQNCVLTRTLLCWYSKVAAE